MTPTTRLGLLALVWTVGSAAHALSSDRSSADPYAGRGTTSRPVEPMRLRAPCALPCLAMEWRTLAPVILVNGVGVEGAASSIRGDKLYVSHGYSGGDVAAMRIYDIPTDTWTTGPTMIDGGRSEMAGAAIGTEHFAFGGRSIFSRLDIFDTVLGLWRPAAPMSIARRVPGVGVIAGRIYAVGGDNGGSPGSFGLVTGINEAYDPLTNTWDPTPADLPVPVSDPATAVIGGLLYVFGGSLDASDFGATNLTQIYDPVANSWRSGAPMPTVRYNATAGAVRGLAVVFGGLSLSSNLSVTEIYDPVADAWCDGPAMPSAAAEMGANAPCSLDTCYAIGTGSFGVSGRSLQAFRVRSAVTVAAAGSDVEVCEGDPVLLDGAGSTNSGCPGGLLYEWRQGMTVVRPASIDPTWSPPTTPPGSTTYTLVVSCNGQPGCESTDQVEVVVVAPPLAAAGDDVDVCAGDAVVLDGSGSSDNGCPGGLLYEWREGVTVVRPASTDPTWAPPTMPPRTSTYTVVVSCAGLAGCTSTDAVTVEFDDCPMAVTYDRYQAIWHSDVVVIEWRTLLEEGTLGYLVERATDEHGPWVRLATWTDARGAGFDYRVTDPTAQATGRPWYRVVEQTIGGPGDATEPFQVASPASTSERGRHRSGGRRR